MNYEMYGYRCTKMLEALSRSKESCLLECGKSECNNVCIVTMVTGMSVDCYVELVGKLC